MASPRRDQFRDEDAQYAADPSLAYVPEDARAVWRTSRLYEIADVDDLDRLKIGFDIVQHLLRLHRAEGGRVLGGSDTFISVPGVSTLRELLFLVDAGFTPLDAITMCTLDNAVFMGADHDIGSVEPGKLADLVVLDADPLESIDNIGRVAAVYRGGTAVDLGGAADPKMPIPRPEMVRPLWVERRLLGDGYRFTQPPFEQPVDHGGGCC